MKKRKMKPLLLLTGLVCGIGILNAGAAHSPQEDLSKKEASAEIQRQLNQMDQTLHQELQRIRETGEEPPAPASEALAKNKKTLPSLPVVRENLSGALERSCQEAQEAARETDALKEKMEGAKKTVSSAEDSVESLKEARDAAKSKYENKKYFRNTLEMEPSRNDYDDAEHAFNDAERELTGSRIKLTDAKTAFQRAEQQAEKARAECEKNKRQKQSGDFTGRT